jgi:hypothetical protein
MISDETRSIIERSRQIYEQHKEIWESAQRNRYVAIEPESGEFFLGDSFDEAVRAARVRYPDRLSHTIRIGHEAAFHLGLMER